MSGCHPDATTKKIAGEQNKTNRGIPRGTEQSNKPSRPNLNYYGISNFFSRN